MLSGSFGGTSLLLCLLLRGSLGFSLIPSTLSWGRLAPLHLFFDRQQSQQQQQNQQADVLQDNDVRRSLEFIDLEPLRESDARRRRIQQDIENQAQFEVFGDPLWDLRSEIEELSVQLLNAMHGGKETMEESTRQKLQEAERRDPELAYKQALVELAVAEREGRTSDAMKHRVTAKAARSCLPQFNLEGLWVGKYGSSYDLINITYVGDTLIAEKVTGDHNVPRGALTFQADLSPLRQINSIPNGELQPITLTEKAARKWGTKKLPRYAGLGQVAEENFRNNQWVDGQLIIIGTEYFSFAWLPIEMQIFFGRPNPELALKMLRDSGVTRVPAAFDAPPSPKAELTVQMDYATRCLEKTLDYEDELNDSPFGCIWHNGESEECYFE
jgi:Cyclin D1 binding domain